MGKECLLIEKQGNVGTLILNRPEKRNSLSPDLLVELHQALEEFSDNGRIRTVVIRGSGEKAFSSGYDISAIPSDTESEILTKKKDLKALERALESVVNFPYPVIAMLNGYAFGAGCELSICCDIRIGADDIRMGMPPAKLGVVYSHKGLERFIRVIGFRNTKELFFTGRYYDAPRIKEMGLVDYLVPREDLQSFTYGLAREISGNAPLSLTGTKKILNLLLRKRSMNEDDLREAQSLIDRAYNSEDLKEGKAAFIQKRTPRFQGR